MKKQHDHKSSFMNNEKQILLQNAKIEAVLSSLVSLCKGTNLQDVTLACDDGQMSSFRVLLALAYLMKATLQYSASSSSYLELAVENKMYYFLALVREDNCREKKRIKLGNLRGTGVAYSAFVHCPTMILSLEARGTIFARKRMNHNIYSVIGLHASSPIARGGIYLPNLLKFP